MGVCDSPGEGRLLADDIGDDIAQRRTGGLHEGGSAGQRSQERGDVDRRHDGLLPPGGLENPARIHRELCLAHAGGVADGIRDGRERWDDARLADAADAERV